MSSALVRLDSGPNGERCISLSNSMCRAGQLSRSRLRLCAAGHTGSLDTESRGLHSEFVMELLAGYVLPDDAGLCAFDAVSSNVGVRTSLVAARLHYLPSAKDTKSLSHPHAGGGAVRTQALPYANSDAGRHPRFHEVIAALLPLLLGGELLLWIVLVPVGLRGQVDFAMFYTAGYMVRIGQSGQLYNYDVETRYQNQMVSKTPAPYTHLPYEALLFAPISLLPYRVAYWLFLFVNLVLAILALLLMPPTGLRRCALVILASFFPVSAALADAQDSIMPPALARAAW